MATSATILVRCILCLLLAIDCDSRQDSERYVRIGFWDGLGGWLFSPADAPSLPLDCEDKPDQYWSSSLAPRRRTYPSRTPDEWDISTFLSDGSGGSELSSAWRREKLEESFVSTKTVIPANHRCSTRKRIRRHRKGKDRSAEELKLIDGGSVRLITPDEDSDGYSTERVRANLVLPLMSKKDCWEKLRGDEFVNDADGSLLDAFTTTCQSVATSDVSEWIDWRPTGKHGDPYDEETINVWVGRSIERGTNGGGRGNGNSEDDYCGSHLPIIKSQSVVPLTPLELADLLLDSSRVRTYNKWSLGRLDVWVHPDPSRRLKIVKNRTKPPVGSKALVSTTMMHARKVSLSSALPASRASQADGMEDAWIVVSRAVGGREYCDDEDADCGRSDILLGINLLEPVGDDSTLVTAITHVQSSVVPSMMAEGLGVKGAIKFVHDLRRLRLKVPA